MEKSILRFSLFAGLLIFFSSLALAAKTTTRKPNQADSAGSTAPQAEKEQTGFVSKKTKMPFSEAQTEDITNENFPDLIESFDYPNAEISDVIKAISELTGRNFIVDPNVRGKISIIAPSQITVAEAYRAFLSALAINGMAVVPYGKFWKIRPVRAAQRDSIETYSGAYYPNSDQMITRIIKLRYINSEEVVKNLRILPSKDGEMVGYPPTNSIIISDFGSNIDRVMKIIRQLDVPGFEEQMEVIRIQHAKARDISDLITSIINKGETKKGFGSSVPRFRRSNNKSSSGGSGNESFSVVLPDERTNSIIVVGNKAGIQKIRTLVAKLDFRLSASDQGGVHVYYVRHSEAKKIADTLNGIATESTKAQEQSSKGGAPKIPSKVGPSASAIFGGDVKVTADEATNSLIITASRQDYKVIEDLLKKIDMARDQVFVKTIIMEMRVDLKNTWGLSVYKFIEGTNGVGRVGFAGLKLDSILNPSSDEGAVLGFANGGDVTIKSPQGAEFTAKSLTGFINFLKSNTGANVLSTPQLMVMDNEKGVIEVGEKVPVGVTQQNATAGAPSTTSIERQNVTIKLELTPYISPDSPSVQLKIDQNIEALSTTPIKAARLAEASTATTKRSIQTQISVDSGDTAVLGGLMSDSQEEQVKKVPILGDIPILGWLFKTKSVEKKKQNLMVFITPKIIRSKEHSSQILDEKLDERLDFIQKNMNGKDPNGETFDNIPRLSSDEVPSDSELEEPAVETF